jgi:hypothetical protein
MLQTLLEERFHLNLNPHVERITAIGNEVWTATRAEDALMTVKFIRHSEDIVRAVEWARCAKFKDGLP